MAAKKTSKITSNVAKSGDGTVQITFTIPFALINKSREATALELGKTLEIPGFRKGKAPLDKLLSAIPPQTLIEKTLASMLPEALGKTIQENKIKPVMYPKLELISAEEDKDWQVRAVTAELSEIKLGDYKKQVSDALKAKAIWTPGSGDPKEGTTEKTKEEKEQIVINTLIEKIDLSLPKVLVEEEVNKRLSQLLERIEKLGLSLDGYLLSIGKTSEQVRGEYEDNAKEALKIDLILGTIAQNEKVEIDPKIVDEAIKASSADPSLAKSLDTPEQRAAIEAVLKKKEVLSKLIA